MKRVRKNRKSWSAAAPIRSSSLTCPNRRTRKRPAAALRRAAAARPTTAIKTPTIRRPITRRPPGGPTAHASSVAAERHAFYCLTGNLLVVTDNREVLEGILGRAMGHHSRGSLAEHKPFQMVMNRCWADYGKGGEMPQMRWFIHPLGYAEASRAATPEYRRRKGKTILEVMRHQGVEAVQGLGGFADFASEEYELVHRTAVYAPGRTGRR